MENFLLSFIFIVFIVFFFILLTFFHFRYDEEKVVHRRNKARSSQICEEIWNERGCDRIYFTKK